MSLVVKVVSEANDSEMGTSIIQKMNALPLSLFIGSPTYLYEPSHFHERTPYRPHESETWSNLQELLLVCMINYSAVIPPGMSLRITVWIFSVVLPWNHFGILPDVLHFLGVIFSFIFQIPANVFKDSWDFCTYFFGNSFRKLIRDSTLNNLGILSGFSLNCLRISSDVPTKISSGILSRINFDIFF